MAVVVAAAVVAAAAEGEDNIVVGMVDLGRFDCCT